MGVMIIDTYRGMENRGFGSQHQFPYKGFGWSQQGVNVWPHYPFFLSKECFTIVDCALIYHPTNHCLIPITPLWYL